MLLKVLQWGKAQSSPHDVISGGDKVAYTRGRKRLQVGDKGLRN